MDVNYLNKYAQRTEHRMDERVLENMLSYLTELYLTIETYPHKIQGFWDVPNPPYALEFKSKDELYGRMKQLGQLLNAKQITVPLTTSEVTVELQ